MRQAVAQSAFSHACRRQIHQLGPGATHGLTPRLFIGITFPRCTVIAGRNFATRSWATTRSDVINTNQCNPRLRDRHQPRLPGALQLTGRDVRSIRRRPGGGRGYVQHRPAMTTSPSSSAGCTTALTSASAGRGFAAAARGLCGRVPPGRLSPRGRRTVWPGWKAITLGCCGTHKTAVCWRPAIRWAVCRSSGSTTAAA